MSDAQARGRLRKRTSGVDRSQADMFLRDFDPLRRLFRPVAGPHHEASLTSDRYGQLQLVQRLHSMSSLKATTTNLILTPSYARARISAASSQALC